jgi:hypothetical protein
MPVERTTAYTTSDGKIFIKPEDAHNHQEELDLMQTYAEHPLYGNHAGSYVEFDDLTQWLRENKTFARALLRQFT